MIMKRILLSLGWMMGVITASAQNFQMTIKAGSSPNSVRAVIRPANTMANVQMSSAQVTILVPVSIGVPRPVASIKTNYITGMGYVSFLSVESTPAPESSSFYVYQFDGVGGPTVPFLTFNANTEYDLLEIQFANRPDVVTQVRVAQLPNGGVAGDAPGQYNFYLAMGGVDVVNQSNQFYGASSSNDGNGYAGYSFAALNGVVLPVRLLDFQVTRQNNDALIQWKVSEDGENERFELERSLDGVNFLKIADVPKKVGNGTKTYEFTDLNLRSHNKPVIHYRVKDVDYSGRFSYTKIIPIRLDLKGAIALYPNPAKDGFYVSIPYQNPDGSRVQLQLINKAGQVLETKQITKTMATNYYFNVNPAYTSGDYTLRIFEEQTLVDTKKVVVVR